MINMQNRDGEKSGVTNFIQTLIVFTDKVELVWKWKIKIKIQNIYIYK